MSSTTQAMATAAPVAENQRIETIDILRGFYYAELEFYQIYFVVLVIWAIQLIISPIWLKYFLFGPLECYGGV